MDPSQLYLFSQYLPSGSTSICLSLRVNNLSKQCWMSFLDVMYSGIKGNEQEIMHECVCINTVPTVTYCMKV